MRRPVLVLRLVVYGTVALLGLGVYFARTHASGGPVNPGVRLSGATDEGVPARVYVQDDRVAAIRVGWRTSECERGATWPSFNATLDESMQEVERDGRAFAFSDSKVFDNNGWQVRATVTAGGELSEDGRSAWGHAVTTGEWLSQGRVVATCRSGIHTWSAKRG